MFDAQASSYTSGSGNAARGVRRWLAKQDVKPDFVDLPVKASKHSAEEVMRPWAVLHPAKLAAHLLKQKLGFFFGGLSVAQREEYWSKPRP